MCYNMITLVSDVGAQFSAAAIPMPSLNNGLRDITSECCNSDYDSENDDTNAPPLTLLCYIYLSLSMCIYIYHYIYTHFN